MRSLVRNPLMILLAAIVVGSWMATTPSPGSAAGTVIFGADAGTDENGSDLQPLLDLEAEIGRQLDLVRVFLRWDDDFISAYLSEIENSDRILFVSVKAKNLDGSTISWRDIADATPGTALHDDMIEWVDRIEAWDGDVWFGFHHEPEGSGSAVNGDAADFKDAWRTFIGLFKDRNLAHVKYAWIMTYWSFATDPSDVKYADKWYPGDEYVDIITATAYNWDNCKGNDTDPWMPLTQIIEPMRQFGLAHPDKGLALAEWASTEKPSDNGAAKAAWIDDVAEMFQQPEWNQFVGLAYFNVFDDTYPNCLWELDSSTAAMEAFTAMGADPFYGGTGGDGTTTLPPSTTAPPGSTSTSAPPTTDPPGNPGPDGFYDVVSDNLFFDDIVWLAQSGITKGCNPPDNDMFCPTSHVTRAQMAAFLVRAVGYTADGGGNLFIDDDGLVFEADIDKLATAGVTKGCNPPINDEFCPNGDVTREVMAAFLHRALGD